MTTEAPTGSDRRIEIRLPIDLSVFVRLVELIDQEWPGTVLVDGVDGFATFELPIENATEAARRAVLNEAE